MSRLACLLLLLLLSSGCRSFESRFDSIELEYLTAYDVEGLLGRKSYQKRITPSTVDAPAPPHLSGIVKPGQSWMRQDWYRDRQIYSIWFVPEKPLDELHLPDWKVVLKEIREEDQ